MRRILAVSILAFGLPAMAELQPALECEMSLVTPDFRLLSDPHPDHTRRIRELTRDVHRQTQDNNLPVRPSHITGIRNFEQVMFLLALGDAESIIPIIHNSAVDADDSTKAMNELAAKIAPLQKSAVANTLDEAGRKQLDELEKEFLRQAAIHGDSYGAAKNVLLLLQSVADGKGVPEKVGIPNLDGPDTGHEITLDLTTPSAVGAAKSLLGIVWEWNKLPGVEQMQTAWANSPYSLRAKLERDIAELKGLNRIDRVAVNFLAWVATTTTDALKFLPERYRQVALKFSGMRVDEFMKQLYMGKIQRLVHATRRRTSDGKLVMIKEEATLGKLAEAVKELSDASWANDLLLTYARLGYFNPYWKQLKALIAKKAEKDPSFKRLAARMEDAQKSAIDAGNIIYVYDRAKYQEAQFLIAQTAHMILLEEGTRRYLLPGAGSAANLISDWASKLLGLLPL